MPVAIEQPGTAQTMLQLGDALRQRGLGHAERLGRGTERAVPRDGEQVQQPAGIDPHEAGFTPEGKGARSSMVGPAKSV